MKKYVFFDWNDAGDKLDITGEDYQRLITACARHSSYFSLLFLPEHLKDWNDPIHTALFATCFRQEDGPYWTSSGVSEEDEILYDEPIQTKCYFPCTEENIQYLKTKVEKLFDWVLWRGDDNPEDLQFYRKDGSLIFDSVIHEGFCLLHLLPEEESDFQSVVAQHGWAAYTGDVPMGPL